MRQSPIALAVASASLVAMQSGQAADITVSNPASCEADLRQAIADVNSVAGDMVVIDPAACPEITLTSAIVVSGNPFILSAPVGADGRPLVTIRGSSGATFGLFDLQDPGYDGSDIVASVNARIPVIFSGLELTGASNSGPGGAIYASNHAVILDKSVVSNNTAVGSGGGIAVRGDLCLVGTEISGNTVTHEIEERVSGDVVTAVGGGAAVRGNVYSVPIAPEGFGLNPAGAGSTCLSENSELLTTVSPEFAQAAGSLAGLPDTVEAIPSKITGNTVRVDIRLAGLTNPDAARFYAFGGGLAAMADGVPREANGLGGFYTPCASYMGADSTPTGSNCLLALASSIDANAVTMIIDDDLEGDAAPGGIVAGGGGLAAMTEGYARSSMLTPYSNISGNSVAVTVPETANPYGSLVQGGGIGDFDFSGFEELIPIWETTSGLNFARGGSGKYGSALLLGSVVSGNSVSLQGAGVARVEGALDTFAHVGGGGVASISSDEPDTKYDAMVVSLLSSISGNTVEVTAAGESYVGAQGGGISTGWIYASGGRSYLLAGKYISQASGLSNNTVTVAGLAQGKAAGGGASASFTTKLADKPQFTVVDEQALADAKYVGDALDLNLASLWSDPGGVVGNKVDVTLAETAAAEVLAGGGGLLLGEKYVISFLIGATVSGNSVEVNAMSATDGKVTAIGGGAGTIPIYDDHAQHLISVKYGSIDDNAIQVSAPVSVDVTAAGGGLAALQRNLFTEERNLDPYNEKGGTSILASTVSGNTITASGSPNSLAQGGGLAIETAGDDVALSYNSEFPRTVGVSTIANNSLALTGGGTVQAAGLFAEVKYNPAQGLLVDKVTVAGNTSSVDNAVEGGQIYMGVARNGAPPELIEAEEGIFLPPLAGAVGLVNSLVSGDTAQGDQDLYYNFLLELKGTSIYHGPESQVVDLFAVGLGLLAPELADPTYLGDLQFNGGSVDQLAGKYGAGLGYKKTIALLTGSGAIDPLPTEFYDEGAQCAFVSIGSGESSISRGIDQRGNEPVGCPDIGAYEFLGERDGDSLTDGTELVGAATDPELGSGRTGLPGLAYLLPSGDGNSDGVPDVDQAAVSTFTHSTQYGLSTVTLATYVERTTQVGPSGETKAYLDTGSALTDVEIVATTQRTVRIRGVNYELDYGISFSSGTSDGQPERFELILEGSSASSVALVKQVCDEDSEDFGAWRVLDSTPEPFGAGRFRLTWGITEGGDFDCNGEGGGIADPAYIATYDVFPVPTMPWFMVAGLSGLTALGGLLRLRRRRKVTGPR